MSSFELRDVVKHYKMGKVYVEALRSVNLAFQSEDFIGVVGPSGSGKTTLLNILGCLDTPTEGEVIVDDQLILQKLHRKKMEKIRRDKIGFIFQTFNLVPVLTVYENVEYPLLLKKVRKKERKQLVMKALEDVGLQDRALHRPNALSGGERQRVSIARALVKKPKLILADEPTANLDSQTGVQIIELMHRINKDERTTFLFSTHDSRLIELVGKVFVLSDGKLIEEGGKHV